MNAEQTAYIAGFLDGDGSIHIQLIRQREYRFGFYVRVSVSFHQHQTGRAGLEWLKERLKVGYIRNRTGQMSDYVITSRPAIRRLLEEIKPYVVFKRRQVQEGLKLLDATERITTPAEFLAVARRLDAFAALNRSKRRKITVQTVLDEWNGKGRLAPVTTDSAEGSADEIPEAKKQGGGSYASPSKEGGDIVYATSNRGQHA